MIKVEQEVNIDGFVQDCSISIANALISQKASCQNYVSGCLYL